METITDAVVEQITKNLVGYTDLTAATVREAVDKLTDGEKPTEIIGMMAKNILFENGWLLADDDD